MGHRMTLLAEHSVINAKHTMPGNSIIAYEFQGDSGGETGIRTLGGLAPTTVFETAPFDHSGTSPRGSVSGDLVITAGVCKHIFPVF